MKISTVAKITYYDADADAWMDDTLLLDFVAPDFDGVMEQFESALESYYAALGIDEWMLSSVKLTDQRSGNAVMVDFEWIEE